MRFAPLALATTAMAIALLLSPAARAVAAPASSGITAVEIARTEQLGELGGQPFERLVGTVSGRVSAAERVAGLAAVAGPDGTYAYTSGFELIRPVARAARRTVVVEAENRGSPLLLGAFNSFAVPAGAPQSVSYPAGLGNGFLFGGGRAYARVQWQTGLSPGVPANAQGVGEVIMRDFGRLLRDGRLLADGRLAPGGSPLGTYGRRLLVGVSQAGWFVTTFVAEGFNAEPGRRARRVFHGAYAQNGLGNLLAINTVAAADGAPQDPYVRPDFVPRTPAEVLRRPSTDPVFVDVATYTDFYRLRASVSRQAPGTTRYRRYDWPAAHSPAVSPASAELAFERLRCNDGVPIPLNPIDTRPYARALLSALEQAVARRRAEPAALPAERLFLLGGAPLDPALLNGLPDRPVLVPHVDGDAQPLGGVRFPAAELPLGRAVPPALPPVSTASIVAVCGNFGGWQPYTAGELTARYGSLERYLAAYDALAARLVAQGLLLDADRRTLRERAAAEWAAAPSGA